MLILTRRPGETIMIGDDIKIMMVKVQGSQASFGIEAPKSLPVHRQEIYDKLKLLQKIEQQKTEIAA